MDTDAVRAVLERERDELAEELAMLTAAPRDPMSAVSFGKRIGDGTTEAVERLATTSAAKALAGKAEEVERALAKLDEGTYGACDACGTEIPAERLEAIPSAVLCVRCAAARSDASR